MNLNCKACALKWFAVCHFYNRLCEKGKGFESTHKKIAHPGTAKKTLEPEQALESALYLGDKYVITPELAVNLGIRYSIFNYLRHCCPIPSNDRCPTSH